VRHLFNVAVSYNIPSPVVSGPVGTLLGGFGLDFIYRARSGRSTQMLNTGLRGLNALYQIGGPRSLQASLKIGL
jgi:hypothetical protein